MLYNLEYRSDSKLLILTFRVFSGVPLNFHWAQMEILSLCHKKGLLLLSNTD